MVVNTASKCGLTPQYEELEALYKKYGSEKFTIIAFPSNDFMGQEPGSDQDILTFCQKNYGVTFPIMSKVKVKGRSKCEVYEFFVDVVRHQMLQLSNFPFEGENFSSKFRPSSPFPALVSFVWLV